MLLCRSVTCGAAVISIRGPVGNGDAVELLREIADAAALGPRGIVLDLSEAGELSAGALKAVRDARAAAPGWPRPSLHVCCSREDVTAALSEYLPVHADLADGLAHVDDRRSAERRRIDLGGGPQTPARARAATADIVADLHLESLGDDLALVVSELVTNAVRHAEPPVRLEIAADDQRVTVAVADGSSGRPVARSPSDDAEGGRGMILVDLLAEETGVRPSPPGKTVWASLLRG